MLTLDDPRWDALEGGYRTVYDPRPALRRLDDATEHAGAWKELWDELHHQGDVGSASYASIPVLVDIHRRQHSLDWNLYALASTIEIERHRSSNPPIPEWLRPGCEAAWRALEDLALQDLRTGTGSDLVQSALAVVAVGKGELKLGALLNHLDISEVDEFLDEHMNWADLYRGRAV